MNFRWIPVDINSFCITNMFWTISNSCIHIQNTVSSMYYSNSFHDDLEQTFFLPNKNDSNQVYTFGSWNFHSSPNANRINEQRKATAKKIINCKLMNRRYIYVRFVNEFSIRANNCHRCYCDCDYVVSSSQSLFIRPPLKFGIIYGSAKWIKEFTMRRRVCWICGNWMLQGNGM